MKIAWFNSTKLGIKVQNLVIWAFVAQTSIQLNAGERTGLVVRASDSGSGDPGSILGRVDVLFP